jgi:hypothetical protein
MRLYLHYYLSVLFETVTREHVAFRIKFKAIDEVDGSRSSCWLSQRGITH